ncbi:MAG: hypothetical protein AAF351_01170 [Pseudomonadota bacterium]
MKRALLLLIFLTGCEREPPPLPDAFLGTWRSDEALTLESMRQSDQITDDARAVFENRFFGRLVVIFTETERASFFADEDNLPDIVEHNIRDAGENFVVFVEPSNDELGLSSERTWYVDGNIAAVPIEEWGFTEYFRRVTPPSTNAEDSQ